MKTLSLVIPLLVIGCTTHPSRVSSLATPEIPFVEIYHEDEFLGAISIKEGERTELPYKKFIDAGHGEMVGIGVEIIAEKFVVSERTAKGPSRRQDYPCNG